MPVIDDSGNVVTDANGNALGGQGQGDPGPPPPPSFDPRYATQPYRTTSISQSSYAANQAAFAQRQAELQNIIAASQAVVQEYEGNPGKYSIASGKSGGEYVYSVTGGSVDPEKAMDWLIDNGEQYGLGRSDMNLSSPKAQEALAKYSGLAGKAKVSDTYDPAATKRYQAAQQALINASKELSQINNAAQAFTGGGGGAAPVRSYLDIEGDKADESARQFNDYVKRASTVYQMQDQERDYAMKAQAANDKMLQPWNETWGSGSLYNPNRPGPDFSDSVMNTMPAEGPPPLYRLNSAVGLPGGEGYGYQTLGDDPYAGELPLGTVAFAEGTRLPSGSGTPSDLEWMIGMPLFKGKGWEWQPGQVARGFMDRGVAQ